MTTLNDGGVERTAYADGHDGSAFVLYLVKQEHGKPDGHVWFSGEIEGRAPNEITGAFLSRYRSRGTN